MSFADFVAQVMAAYDVVAACSVSAEMSKGSWNFFQAPIDLLFKVKLSREEAIAVLDESRNQFGGSQDRNPEHAVYKAIISSN